MEPDKSDKIGLSEPEFSSKNPSINNQGINERESTRLAKHMFLKAFEDCAGILNVSETAQKAGISRDTYYRWLREDEEFKDKIWDVRSHLNDFVEDLLLEKIQERDGASIRYYLSCRHPDYIPQRKSSLEIKNEYQEKTLKKMNIANRYGA